MSTTNSQVVAAVAESAASTVEQAASLSMANTYMAAASSIGLVMDNAVVAQQGTQQVAQATVATTCALIIKSGSS